MDSECVNWMLVRQLAKSQGCNRCYVNWQVKAPLLCALPPLRGVEALRPCKPQHSLPPVCTTFTHEPRRSWEGRRGRRVNMTMNQEAQKPREEKEASWEKKIVPSVEFQFFLVGLHPWSTHYFTRTTPAPVSDAKAEPQSQSHFLKCPLEACLRSCSDVTGRSGGKRNKMWQTQLQITLKDNYYESNSFFFFLFCLFVPINIIT